MSALITDPNIGDADAIYSKLVAAHKGLSEPEQAALNARLILILMNHIGDADVLEDAIKLAKSA